MRWWQKFNGKSIIQIKTMYDEEPFVQVLRRRSEHNSPINRNYANDQNLGSFQNLDSSQLSKSLPKPLYPTDTSDAYYYSTSNYNDNSDYNNYNSLNSTFNSANNFEMRDIDTVLELRNIISDLEQRIAELNKRKKSEAHLKHQLENEKEISSELVRSLDKINDMIKENEDKVQACSDQIHQLQDLIDSKQQLIDAKDDMIMKLQNEFQQLKEDYQNATLKSSSQIEQLGQLTSEISILNQRVSVLRAQKKRPPPFSPPPPYYNNDLFLDTKFPAPQVPDLSFEPELSPPLSPRNNFDIPKPDFGSFNDFPDRLPPEPSQSGSPSQSYKSPTPNQSPRINVLEQSKEDSSPTAWMSAPPEIRMFAKPVIKSPIHAAFRDNIFFNEINESKPKKDFIDETQSIPEMRESLQIMQKRKDDIEAMLIRSPPKNITMAEAKREKANLENELKDLEQKISKIRLTLKSCNAL